MNIYGLYSFFSRTTYVWDGISLVKTISADADVFPDIFTDDAVRSLDSTFYVTGLSRKAGISYYLDGRSNWVGFVWSDIDSSKILYLYDGRVHKENWLFKDHLMHELETWGRRYGDEIYLRIGDTNIIFSYPGLEFRRTVTDDGFLNK
jgi:hypothetical protein